MWVGSDEENVCEGFERGGCVCELKCICLNG